MTRDKGTPNIGQYGVKSIRLKGMTVDELPIAEAAIAKAQIPIAEEDARKQLIENIKARYPTQDVQYIESRIEEARRNIVRFREQMVRIGSSREEYQMLLHDAKQREKKIKSARKAMDGEELTAEIKALIKEHGPWQVEALKTQMEQFSESISRFESTITEEQEAIDKLSELLGLCKARDKELMRLGA